MCLETQIWDISCLCNYDLCDGGAAFKLTYLFVFIFLEDQESILDKQIMLEFFNHYCVWVQLSNINTAEVKYIYNVECLS